MTEIRIFNGFTIHLEYTTGYPHVHFKVYEQTALLPDGEPLYQRKGSNYSPDTVESIDEAETYLTGTIKWDGCSDINFFDEGYKHSCGMKDALKVGQVIEYLYNECAGIMDVEDSNLYFGG